jgi:hypothetical protein
MVCCLLSLDGARFEVWGCVGNRGLFLALAPRRSKIDCFGVGFGTVRRFNHGFEHTTILT